MNNIIKTFEWLTGQDAIPRPMMRDGIWAMKGWKDLQENQNRSPYTGLFMMFATMVTVALLLPILAWSATVNIPVLKHKLSNGTVISEEDIETREFDENFISPRMLRNKKELIGKEIFRSVRSGVPIYDSYIRVPPTIRKNGVVEIIFTAPGIVVNGKGRSLQDAPAGQMARVMNTASGKIVSGEVTKQGTILVR